MGLLDYLPYIIALTIACAIPGPGVTAAVGTALGAGFQRSVWFVAGIVLGDLCYLTFAVLGLTAIISVFSGFFLIVKIGGAAYLLYLAWTFWQHGVDARTVREKSEKSPYSTLLGGFSLTLGNPKTIIFYMALLPTVIDLRAVTVDQYAVLAILTALIIFAVCIPYTGLASQARRFLANPKGLLWLGRGAAGAMTGAAVFILVRE